MNDSKNKSKLQVPSVPSTPSFIPTASEQTETKKLFKLEKYDRVDRFEYCTKILQLGMAVADSARLIENRCNELSAIGWRFKESIHVNSSEAVLIFERMIIKAI